MARFVVKDNFYKKAKKDGFRARSAYKLQEILEKYRLISKGDKVLDLGAAPGSWLQVESSTVGGSGVVVGIDILAIAPLAAPNVRLKKMDIREMDFQALLTELGIPIFDVITSDIAPNLSGIADVDDANIAELYTIVLRVVKEGLRKGGSFLIKLFMSPQLGDMTADLKPLFAKVITFKPKASRDVSAEVYLICLGKR
jgi:23S rRNA (uridine2552-2'-O)-methyltransferase